MDEEEKKPKVKAKVIVYLGDDDSYFSTIRQRFYAWYPQIEIKYINLFDRKNPKSFYPIFVKVVELAPMIIYLDFSREMKTQIELAKLLRDEVTTRNVPMVGLGDESEKYDQCSVVDFDFFQIKCGETLDVVYDPCNLVFGNELKKPDFANAMFKKETELREKFRIVYFTPTSIYIEGNMKLTKNDVVSVDSTIPKHLSPSKNFIVREVVTGDLAYRYKYGYKMDFVFVDMPEPPAKDEFKDDPKLAEMTYKQNLEEYKLQLRSCEKKTKEWVIDHIEPDSFKKTKILIIDRNMTIFKMEKKHFSKYPYNFRIQTLISQGMDEIVVFRPSIIVFQFPPLDLRGLEANLDYQQQLDPEDVEELKKKDENEGLSQLINMVKKIKSVEGYNPFIVIFNTKKYNSQSFRDSLEYPLILVNHEMLALSRVLEFAKILEKKQELKKETELKQRVVQMKKENPQKNRRLTTADFIEKRYYVKAGHMQSSATIAHPIVFRTMTESECTFGSKKELGLDNFSANFPIDINIKVVKDGSKNYFKDSGMFVYRGLIHNIHEDDKMKLRQFVNKIFFSDLAEKQRKEKEEFEKRNKEEQEKKTKGGAPNDAEGEKDQSAQKQQE
ncbi:MAG: hypothetical protein ISR65_00400 [Bacteriovoracaceae bacterium]|nr:hypothetical protein [Bacteriovoracaceae bacterium]